MEQLIPWIHVALIVLSVAATFAFIAALGDPIRRVLASVMAIALHPVLRIHSASREAMLAVWGWVRDQLKDECERPGDGPVYFFVGSVVYALLTVLFVLCDFGMLVLTAEAMGFEMAQVELPLDTATLTALTLVTVALFWGAVLFDLMGITRLAPWRRSLGVVQRRIFMGIAVLFLSLAVAVAGAMAYWRGASVSYVPEEVEPLPLQGTMHSGVGLSVGGSDMAGDAALDLPPVSAPGLPHPEVVIACQVGLAVLSMSASAFSAVGVVILAKFLVLLAVAVASLPLFPLTFLSWLWTSLIQGLFANVDTMMDFLVMVGNMILHIFRKRSTAPALSPEAEPTTVLEIPTESHSEPDEPEAVPDPGFNPFNPRREP